MNKINVICTDLDGILNDLEAFIDWMIYDYFTSIGKPVPEKKNPNEYDAGDVYELSRAQRNIIWLKYFKYYSLKFGPRSHAFETIKNWQDAGKEVNVTTARAFVTSFFFGKTSRNWVETWFQENGCKPNNILYFSEKGAHIEKPEAFKLLKADFGIDDKPQVIDNLLDICPVGAIKTSHNKLYLPNGKPHEFYNLDDWKQMEQKVLTLDKKGVM